MSKGGSMNVGGPRMGRNSRSGLLQEVYRDYGKAAAEMWWPLDKRQLRGPPLWESS